MRKNSDSTKQTAKNNIVVQAARLHGPSVQASRLHYDGMASLGSYFWMSAKWNSCAFLYELPIMG